MRRLWSLLALLAVAAGYTFLPADDYTSALPNGASENVVSTAATDCNKDGWPDALAMLKNGDVYLLRNTKPGFAVTKVGTCGTVTSNGVQVESRDIDRDGWDDFVCMEAGTNLGAIYYYENSQSVACAYQTRVTVAGTLKNPQEFVLADADRDGDLDILYVNKDDKALAYARQSSASPGTFSSIVSITTTGNTACSMQSADYNGDSYLDITYLDCSPSAGATTNLNYISGTGAGTYGAASVVNSAMTDGWRVIQSDVNADGRQDLFALVGNVATPQTKPISVFLSPSSSRTVLLSLSNVYWLDVGNVNNDSFLDFVVPSTNVLYVVNGTALGAWASTPNAVYTLSSGSIPQSVVVKDFNNDGALDILYAGKGGTSVLGVTYQLKDICYNNATLPHALATIGNCTRGGTKNSVCVLGCKTGYYASSFTYGVCTGAGWIPNWVGMNNTCTPISCPPIASGAGFNSACPSSTQAYSVTCRLSCATGYSGNNVTRTCGTTGSGTWDTNAVPACTAVTCPAIANGANYVTSCAAVNQTFASYCGIDCATGYVGTRVARFCIQPSQGGPGAWNSTALPTCTYTTCPSIASGGNYASSCAASTPAVGATCTTYCRPGYQGGNVTHSCLQSGAGGPVAWGSTTPAACTATTCPAISSNVAFESGCTTDVNVGSTCSLLCCPGYAGANVTRTCTQASVGAPAAWDTTTLPTCLQTTCPAIVLNATRSSNCSSDPVAVGGTCRLDCGAGYLGSTSYWSCGQASVGAVAAYGAQPLPTCAAACSSVAGNAALGYSSGCASTSTAVGGVCVLSCALGYYGPSVPYQCTSAVTWNTTATPNCTLYACPVLQSGTGYTSSCESTQSVAGAQCDLACALGYTGTAVTRTCQATYNWDSTAPPVCTIVTCPVVANASVYVSSCSLSAKPYQSTCTLQCRSGYAGSSLVTTCQYSANWSPAPTITCLPTFCGTLGNGTGFVSTCSLSNSGVGGTCSRSCVSGFVGSSVSGSCVQTAAGATAQWTLSSTPSCSVTQCANIPATSVYDSACASSTTNVGASCLVSCAAGQTGEAVTQWCTQANSASLAAWNASMPACVTALCPPVPNGQNFTSSCAAGGPVAYGGSCSFTCNHGFFAATGSSTCVQPVAGGAGAWSPAPTIDCGSRIVCPSISNGTSYWSSCMMGTRVAGDTCKLGCRSAYLAAVVTHTCQVTGNWDSDTPPLCTPLSCPAVNAADLAPGVLVGSCTGGLVHDVCSLSCDNRYRPSNLAVGTCTVTVSGVAAAYTDQRINCTYTQPVCGNGVIEENEACDLGSQTMASPSSCCRNCSFVPGALCRASGGPCDEAEYCLAGHDTCPANKFSNSTRVCAPAMGACVTQTNCNGMTPLCPPPVYAAGGTSCTGVDSCLGGDVCVAGTGQCLDGTVLACCGDGHLDALEQCDDGNTVDSDGCSICRKDPGFNCPTPGLPCERVSCTNGQVPDCFGDCGGFALIDACGECYGGRTGRIGNASLDVCGVCHGMNKSLDLCNECYGNNRALDKCGVCHGDDSTCLGCDGVPNSGKTFDICGICGGKGTTCLGCNGLPIGAGGVNYDSCGVCGGDGTQCVLGCDGVWGSGVAYDCARVCGGSARLDRCGMCAGGTTGKVPDQGYNPACGTCFSVCTAPCDYDVCGVCNGDGTSCVGCNHLPIGQGGQTYDKCGVCGGNNQSCVLGCDGIINSNMHFDCAGLCGGNASVDTCGICSGGDTEITPNMHRDHCDVCFGADRNRDSCGVCFATSDSRDDCAVCNGHNAMKDACGICYGYNRTRDACGVCGGGGTSCLGCDNLPNTGRVLDSCGLCGGDGQSCLSAAAIEDSSSASTTTIAVSASAGAFLLIALVVIAVGFAMARHARKVKIYAFVSNAEKKEEALAPTGRVAFVVTDIQNSTHLWEFLPEEMSAALEEHNTIMRANILAHRGYEVKTEGDSFRVAFQDAADAVRFCLAVQADLLKVTWAAALIEQPDCARELSGTDLIWNGLRVRMGVHFGDAIGFFEKRSMRMDYKGITVFTTIAVQAVASGGQVIVSEAVTSELARQNFFSDPASSEIMTAPLGLRTLKGVTGALGLHQVSSLQLSKRPFKPLRTARGGATYENTNRLSTPGGSARNSPSQRSAQDSSRDSSRSKSKTPGSVGGKRNAVAPLEIPNPLAREHASLNHMDSLLEDDISLTAGSTLHTTASTPLFGRSHAPTTAATPAAVRSPITRSPRTPASPIDIGTPLALAQSAPAIGGAGASIGGLGASFSSSAFTPTATTAAGTPTATASSRASLLQQTASNVSVAPALSETGSMEASTINEDATVTSVAPTERGGPQHDQF